jgi:hypothetical protein
MPPCCVRRNWPEPRPKTGGLLREWCRQPRESSAPHQPPKQLCWRRSAHRQCGDRLWPAVQWAGGAPRRPGGPGLLPASAPFYQQVFAFRRFMHSKYAKSGPAGCWRVLEGPCCLEVWSSCTARSPGAPRGPLRGPRLPIQQPAAARPWCRKKGAMWLGGAATASRQGRPIPRADRGARK